MTPDIALAYEFVEYIPEELEERTVYISVVYATAVHKCCCGCGREVVTPLSPTGWKLIFDGKSVSLYPSIGNWSLPCQSHYFITKNRAIWAPRWTTKQIAQGRAREAKAKERYFAQSQGATAHETASIAPPPAAGRPRETLWQKMKRWFS